MKASCCRIHFWPAAFCRSSISIWPHATSDHVSRVVVSAQELLLLVGYRYKIIHYNKFEKTYFKFRIMLTAKLKTELNSLFLLNLHLMYLITFKMIKSVHNCACRRETIIFKGSLMISLTLTSCRYLYQVSFAVGKIFKIFLSNNVARSSFDNSLTRSSLL